MDESKETRNEGVRQKSHKAQHEESGLDAVIREEE